MSTPYENFQFWMKLKNGGQAALNRYETQNMNQRNERDTEQTLSKAVNSIGPKEEAKGPHYQGRAIPVPGRRDENGEGVKSYIGTNYNAEEFGNKRRNLSDMFSSNRESSYSRGKPHGEYSGKYKSQTNRIQQNVKSFSDSKNNPELRFQLVKCSPPEILIWGSRFYFPDSIKELIKKHKGYYSNEYRGYVVKLEDYYKLVHEVAPILKEYQVQLRTVPDFVFKAIGSPIPFQRQARNLTDYDYTRDTKCNMEELPPSINGSLYNFQRSGIKYGIEHHGRVLIGDEMGVGKTIQALAISFLYRADWPLLVIAPSSLKLNWVDEIRRWLPGIGRSSIGVMKDSKTAFSTQMKVYIMSYDLAKNVQDKLEKMEFKVVIADEAHYLKSRDAKRTKVLLPVMQRAKRVILLSGTPILNKPVELYTLGHILRPDIFPTFRDFAYRYCSPHQGYYGIDYSGSENCQELHCIISNNFMIRRLKSEVLSELPSKLRQKIDIPTDSKLDKEINKIMSHEHITEESLEKGRLTAFLHGEGGGEEEGGGDSGSLIDAYVLTGRSKIRGIVDFVGMLLENECKFLIFGHHREVLNGIEEKVQKSHKGYIRIDGSTQMHKRHELVQSFQNNPQCTVAILSITACSQGITLTASSTVVFAEMIWTPGMMEQAEDRVHRIGQTNAVNIYYLYGPHTVDRLIFPRLKFKTEVIGSTLDGRAANYHIDQGNQEEVKQETIQALNRKKRDQNSRLKLANDNLSQTTQISKYFSTTRRVHSGTNSDPHNELPFKNDVEGEETKNELNLREFFSDLDEDIEDSLETSGNDKQKSEDIRGERSKKKSRIIHFGNSELVKDKDSRDKEKGGIYINESNFKLGTNKSKDILKEEKKKERRKSDSEYSSLISSENEYQGGSFLKITKYGKSKSKVNKESVDNFIKESDSSSSDSQSQNSCTLSNHSQIRTNVSEINRKNKNKRSRAAFEESSKNEGLTTFFTEAQRKRYNFIK